MADKDGADRAIEDPNPMIDGRRANVNLAYLGAKPKLNSPGTCGLLLVRCCIPSNARSPRNRLPALRSSTVCVYMQFSRKPHGTVTSDRIRAVSWPATVSHLSLTLLIVAARLTITKPVSFSF